MWDIFHQEIVNSDQQLNGAISENSREADKTLTTSQSSSTKAPKVLMVINKDGSKTIMTLVSGKNMSESDSGSNLAADASNDSQDSNSGMKLSFLCLHQCSGRRAALCFRSVHACVHAYVPNKR